MNFQPAHLFWKLRSQVKFKFMLGHWLLVNLTLVMLFKDGVLMCVCLLLGVSCAREMVKVRIICFYIVTTLSSCGLDCFRQLKSLGWCQLLVCLCFQSWFMLLEKVKKLECCGNVRFFWVIWIERNRRIFEDLEKDVILLWERVWLLDSLWGSVTKEFHNSSFFFIHLN